MFFNRLIFCFVFYKLMVLHFKSGNCESFHSDWSPLGQCDCNGWWLSIRKSTCVFIVFEKCPADTTKCLIMWELIFLSLATEHRGNRTKRRSQVCKRFYCIEAPSKHTQVSGKKTDSFPRCIEIQPNKTEIICLDLKKKKKWLLKSGLFHACLNSLFVMFSCNQRKFVPTCVCFCFTE